MSATALEFREVTVRYEPAGPAVLDRVALVVRPGERVALVGLNGSGKTTLLAAAVGLVPHEGEIRVAGERLGPGTLARVRERVGFLFNVPEDQLLFPRVIDDAAFVPLRRGMAREAALARARQALADMGVEALAEAPVHHLSHGQKQRVALAGALATGPSLLLLDEPSAGLDPPAGRALAPHLAGMDAAMVIATHDLVFARLACARYVLIEGGRVALDDADPSAILARWDAAGPGSGR
ncbi:MAG: ABC transporter ATP-binding protein [Deltaproteobacteria bacterium]|nr:ABC transporter ATP-binding protein [Deltaproteobacteria bacterium]